VCWICHLVVVVVLIVQSMTRSNRPKTSSNDDDDGRCCCGCCLPCTNRETTSPGVKRPLIRVSINLCSTIKPSRLILYREIICTLNGIPLPLTPGRGGDDDDDDDKRDGTCIRSGKTRSNSTVAPAPAPYSWSLSSLLLLLLLLVVVVIVIVVVDVSLEGNNWTWVLGDSVQTTCPVRRAVCRESNATPIT